MQVTFQQARQDALYVREAEGPARLHRSPPRLGLQEERYRKPAGSVRDFGGAQQSESEPGRRNSFRDAEELQPILRLNDAWSLKMRGGMRIRLGSSSGSPSADNRFK